MSNNETTEIIEQEPCGCEFKTLIDNKTEQSFTVLHKCRCKKHYQEQLEATWYDGQGIRHHTVRSPDEVAGMLPLETCRRG